MPGPGAHALLTRPPLSPGPKPKGPFDLHVLGAPPAFVLSQDQTLSFILVPDQSTAKTKHRRPIKDAGDKFGRPSPRAPFGITWQEPPRRHPPPWRLTPAGISPPGASKENDQVPRALSPDPPGSRPASRVPQTRKNPAIFEMHKDQQPRKAAARASLPASPLCQTANVSPRVKPQTWIRTLSGHRAFARRSVAQPCSRRGLAM
jgi:hypothetical protein